MTTGTIIRAPEPPVEPRQYSYTPRMIRTPVGEPITYTPVTEPRRDIRTVEKPETVSPVSIKPAIVHRQTAVQRILSSISEAGFKFGEKHPDIAKFTSEKVQDVRRFVESGDAAAQRRGEEKAAGIKYSDFSQKAYESASGVAGKIREYESKISAGLEPYRKNIPEEYRTRDIGPYAARSAAKIIEMGGMLPGGAETMFLKRPEVIPEALAVGAYGATVGLAKDIVRDPHQGFTDTAAAMLLGMGGMRVLRKPGLGIKKVDLPTSVEPVPYWKGLTVADRPVIGKTPSGIEIGYPKKGSLPKEFEPAKYVPQTKLETKVMARKQVFEEIGYKEPAIEVEKVKTVVDIMGITKHQKSKFIEKEFIHGAKTLTPESTRAVIDIARKSPHVESLYGSFAARSQLKPEFRRVPGDIDIQLKTKSLSHAERFTKEVYTVLQKRGEKVRISKDSSTLIESYGKDKQWHHAVDIHYKGEPVTDVISPLSEGAYGFEFARKPVKIEDVPAMQLNEHGLRKGASILSFQKEKLGPAAHRMKDIPDFYATQETLLESMGITTLGRRRRGLTKLEKVKELFPEAEFKVSEPVKIEIPKEVIPGRNVRYTKPYISPDDVFLRSPGRSLGYSAHEILGYSIGSPGYPDYSIPGYPVRSQGYPDYATPGYPVRSRGYPDYSIPGYPVRSQGYPDYAPPGYPDYAPPGYPDYAPPGYPGYAPPGYPGYAPPGYLVSEPPPGKPLLDFDVKEEFIPRKREKSASKLGKTYLWFPADLGAVNFEEFVSGGARAFHIKDPARTRALHKKWKVTGQGLPTLRQMEAKIK